ncbi:MAG: hypothetical protein ACLFPI_04375 [Desulfobacterales bacterium]
MEKILVVYKALIDNPDEVTVTAVSCAQTAVLGLKAAKEDHSGKGCR